MKKFFLTLLILVIISVTTLFVRPDFVINPRSLAWALNRSKVLKFWSWDEAMMNHEWVRWNKRHLTGHFKNLCLEVQRPAIELKTCLNEVSWNFILSFDFEGVEGKTIDPLKVYSQYTSITLLDLPQGVPEKKGPTPDLWKYWKLLWSEAVPSMEVDFKEIVFKKGKFNESFDLRLSKDEKKLKGSSRIFELEATPKEVVLTVPKKYPLPDKIGLGRPLFFRGMKLMARMGPKEIPLHLTGGLEALTIDLRSRLDLPIKDDLKKKLLLNTTAELTLPDVRGNLKKFGPKPLDVLPAPFNVLNGNIKLKVHAVAAERDNVLIKGLTKIDLKSGKQVFQMDIESDVLLNVDSLRPGTIALNLDFEKIALQLPRYDKKALPPQFFPDGRIKRKAEPPRQKRVRQAQEDRPLLIHLAAQGDEALHIMTNLLDEPLRLNMDLLIGAGQIQQGHLDVLPLRTKVFKRPVYIPNMRLTFNYPMGPVIEGNIIFTLQKYRISLALKGPASRPTFAFSSDPPLTQNDIYAVLLFGRPMSELNPDESATASKTGELLSQRLLSLSVLFFLVGSPVEYVGYDKTKGSTSALIGLGSKSSLRVEATRQGWSGASVRRSLGKGWYLDTSVENTQAAEERHEDAYGVMLERIIAY